MAEGVAEGVLLTWYRWISFVPPCDSVGLIHEVTCRSRQFPSLINCTTADYYTPWPADGLRAVAKQFLTNSDLGPSVGFLHNI